MKSSTPGGGGGKFRRYAAAPLAEINIIPLVDVTLVILIIFMVTMSFKKKTEPRDPVFQMPIVLPHANAATDKPLPGELLVIGVDKSGKKYVGGQAATTETMLQRVRDAAKKPGIRVRIDADRDARYRDVIELVEMCQFEGITNVALRTANKN